jgi:predicted chitinase
LGLTGAYCETLEGAIESSCFFWSTNKLNLYADKKDVKGLTKAINGGDIGMAERERSKHYENNRHLKGKK